jgi:hypothetical protein
MQCGLSEASHPSGDVMNVLPGLNRTRLTFPLLQFAYPVSELDRITGIMADNQERRESKERNRLAAKKWRSKKDMYLGEMESTNDDLRRQALGLASQMHKLRVENKVLEDELGFFQKIVSGMMRIPRETQHVSK